jgi:hypothetical protein
MGVSIWHELETATHPVRQRETDMVQDGARFGKAAVEVYAGRSDAAVLSVALRRTVLLGLTTPENLVGLSLGIRAGRLGTEVLALQGDAYRMNDATEIERLRRAKATGTHAAELNEGKSLESILGEAAKVAEGGASSLQDATDLVGFTMGVRAFQLQGARL